MTVTDPPHVFVLPAKFQAGIDNLSDTVDPLMSGPFAEAFARQFDTDAHFVTYSLKSQGDIPRINKPALPHLRQAGDDLLTTMLVLDYDTPNHSRWTPEAQAKWLEDLAALSESFPLAWQWTLLYTTRNGARLVYVLDAPVPVDQSEKRHQWLCQEFTAKGLDIDKATSDWTRVFRMPYVLRDAKPTWEDTPAVVYLEQPANRLNIQSLGEADPLDTALDAGGQAGQNQRPATVSVVPDSSIW